MYNGSTTGKQKPTKECETSCGNFYLIKVERFDIFTKITFDVCDFDYDAEEFRFERFHNSEYNKIVAWAVFNKD